MVTAGTKRAGGAEAGSLAAKEARVAPMPGSQAAAREARVAASGASASVTPAGSKTTILGISDTVPLRPTLPSEADIASGKAPLLITYMKALTLNVIVRLSLWLYDHAKIALRQPLYKLNCPMITELAASQAAALPTAFKEAWKMENCRLSLKATGLYEAAMPVWQFAPTCEVWEGMDLLHNEPSWQQCFACLGHWSEANLVASAAEEGKRRFIFPGFLPTAVRGLESVTDVAEKAFFQGFASLWRPRFPMVAYWGFGCGARS